MLFSLEMGWVRKSSPLSGLFVEVAALRCVVVLAGRVAVVGGWSRDSSWPKPKPAAYFVPRLACTSSGHQRYREQRRDEPTLKVREVLGLGSYKKRLSKTLLPTSSY